MKISPAFTLIEVLISTAIVALLALASLPQINRATHSNAVRVETQRLVSFLRNAQAITLAGKGAGSGGFQGYEVEVDSANKSYKLVERNTGDEKEAVTIDKDYLTISPSLKIDFSPMRREFIPTGDSYFKIENKNHFSQCAHLNGQAGLIEMVDCP